MAYPNGPAQTYGNWPVGSDVGRRLLSADPVAAVLLILGGLACLVQLFVPWTRTTADSGTGTGWQLFQALKKQLPGLGFSYTFAAYALIAVAVVGVAMVLLGGIMFAPIDHRPPGIVALLAAVIAIVCAGWWAFWGPTGGISDMFSRAGVGWYLFIVGGVVGLIGAIKSLVSGTAT